MPLIRIAERIHCHIPAVGDSVRRWLTGDALDQESGRRHIRRLVEDQAEAGAEYLDVNVDDLVIDAAIGRDGAKEAMRRILATVVRYGRGIPPCVDSSDPELLQWGLECYAELASSGAKPLVNSVTASRLEPLALRRHHAFSVVGMLLERAGDAGAFTDIAGPEAYHETARYLYDRARAAGFAADEIFFDPAVGPLGADMVGYTHRTCEGIRAIRTDPEMGSVHITIGLSNCSEGLPRRLGLNRAYLRVAMEYGVDAAILDVVNVTEHDGVDWHVLNLVRRVAAGDGTDALTLLVDFARAHPPTPAPVPRAPFADAFGAGLRDPQQTLYVMEMTPTETTVDEIYALAEAARDTPVTLSITDTPGGKHTPGPDSIALEVARIMGRQPIVNLSCKSDDRNGLLRRVLGLYHNGLRQFFAVTGDYPQEGRGSFDLDAVTLLQAIDALRRGIDYPSLQPRPQALEGVAAGAAVTPFKYAEADLWGQYLKLWKKWRLGAQYFITQVGFDVRKFQELRLYMGRAGMGGVPVLGSVYFVTPRILYFLNRYPVPGIVIPDDVNLKHYGILLPAAAKRRTRKMSFAELAAYQSEHSRRRAALLAHILTAGLGYRGIDLAGIHDWDDAAAVLETVRQLQSRDWRESYEEYRQGDDKRDMGFAPEGAFYLFPEGGGQLLADGPLQAADRAGYPRASARMAWAHRVYFEPGGWGYGLLRWAACGDPEGARLRWLTLAEQAIKTETLGCEMCGDCRIADLQYRCPEPSRGCAKRLLNGPCGGTDARGMCEVHPDRRCYWGEVIEAALRGGGCGDLYKVQLPKESSLQHTSSWRSEFLERVPRPLDLGQPEDPPPPGKGGTS